MTDLQTPFDAAVVITTIVRPTLAQAVRSVYAQRFDGRIQVLVGVDRCTGDRELLATLARECPSHCALTVVDLGYSTSRRNGGLHPSDYGGALRTILSFAANSRWLAYLDDDNWYAPNHLASLRAAAAGKAWAFAQRYIVDAASDRVVCVDRWESVGPGHGVFRDSRGGFVDTSCFLIDKLACGDALAEWTLLRHGGGAGGDVQVFAKLRDRPWGTHGEPTVYYRVRLANQHRYMLWQMKKAGADLAQFMKPEDLPGDDVWAQCAAFDRGEAVTAVHDPRRPAPPA